MGELEQGPPHACPSTCSLWCQWHQQMELWPGCRHSPTAAQHCMMQAVFNGPNPAPPPPAPLAHCFPSPVQSRGLAGQARSIQHVQSPCQAAPYCRGLCLHPGHGLAHCCCCRHCMRRVRGQACGRSHSSLPTNPPTNPTSPTPPTTPHIPHHSSHHPTSPHHSLHPPHNPPP